MRQHITTARFQGQKVQTISWEKMLFTLGVKDSPFPCIAIGSKPSFVVHLAILLYTSLLFLLYLSSNIWYFLPEYRLWLIPPLLYSICTDDVVADFPIRLWHSTVFLSITLSFVWHVLCIYHRHSNCPPLIKALSLIECCLSVVVFLVCNFSVAT